MPATTRSVLTTLTTLALAIVAALAVVTMLVWWRQERIVFQPPRPPFPGAGNTRRVDYVASDGQPLFAYVLGERLVSEGEVATDTGTPPRRVLLVFHGNADLSVWLIPWAHEVASRTGHIVFLAEYRGYGGLGGVPTYEASRLDARAAYGVVRDSLKIAPADIALFGHSLGSAVASELASEVSPRVLILMSPFTSAREMARRMVAPPFLAFWGLISRIHFDTVARVAALEAPVWVSHGERDLIIPARMGRRVYEAARSKGELLLVPRAGHNDVPDTGGEEYWRWMARALR